MIDHAELCHINQTDAVRGGQPDSHAILENIKYWAPPVRSWHPLKKNPNSSLRMACVVEDRLYQGLRFEGEALLLTPANWKHVLRYGKPDFLIIESAWTTATGHWYMGQCPRAPGRDELLEIVRLGRKLSIPAVFWLTKGHEYHEHYKAFARHFDYVFCADLKEAELLRADGIKAEVLLPCVQPAVYNPFRLYEDYDAFSLDILYDGWADLDRMGEELNVLKKVKEFGVSIIESRYRISRSRLGMLPEYRDCVLGCVSERSRIQALRYAKAYITHYKTLSTQTTQQWMSLEAAACHLPVVHYGMLTEDDLRKRAVIELPDEMDFLAEFVRFQEDELYRERVAHRGWCKVSLQDTFSHRVRTVCDIIGINYDGEEFPKASLIATTFQREMMPHFLEAFERQTYPNKELILVFNGNGPLSPEECGLEKPRVDVKLANVPGELVVGACLSQGALLAEGKYFFVLKENNHYGENYILDMIIHARCIDADLLVKASPYPNINNISVSYEYDQGPRLSIFSQKQLATGNPNLDEISIVGGSLSHMRFSCRGFSYNEAISRILIDSLTQEGFRAVFAIMDGFNSVPVVWDETVPNVMRKHEHGETVSTSGGHVLVTLNELMV